MNKYLRQELVAALNNGLQYLTEQEKISLFLTYYEDLSVAEILAVMELSAMDYQKLITNARTKMRQFTDVFDVLDKKFGTAYIPDELFAR